MHQCVEPAEDLVDAVMSASRVLVGVAARSLAGVAEEVTLPQFRMLMVLASRGPQRPVDLAGALAVAPSTATRMCDRLVTRKWVRRQRPSTDRRTVQVRLTPEGRQLVDDVIARRRVELRQVLCELPAHQHAELTTALRALCEAADERAEREWALV